MIKLITNKDFLLVMMALSIAVLLFIEFEGCNKRKVDADIHKAMTDSLHKTINKLGQETAVKKLLFATISQLKTMHLEAKDSLLILIKKKYLPKCSAGPNQDLNAAEQSRWSELCFYRYSFLFSKARP